MPGVAAEPAPGHPPVDLLAVDLDERGKIDRFASLGQGVVERLRLRAVAREAIEDGADLGVRLVETTEQHPDRDVVRHELPALHEAPRLEADRRTVTDGGPEQVARRDDRDPEALGEHGGLGPLPRTRRSQQDHDLHRRTSPADLTG